MNTWASNVVSSGELPGTSFLGELCAHFRPNQDNTTETSHITVQLLTTSVPELPFKYSALAWMPDVNFYDVRCLSSARGNRRIILRALNWLWAVCMWKGGRFLFLFESDWSEVRNKPTLASFEGELEVEWWLHVQLKAVQSNGGKVVFFLRIELLCFMGNVKL